MAELNKLNSELTKHHERTLISKSLKLNIKEFLLHIQQIETRKVLMKVQMVNFFFKNNNGNGILLP